MKRSLSEMTIPELQIEHKKMLDTIDRLKGTQDTTGMFQLESACAFKFALECQIKQRVPAPTLRSDNILDFAQYKRTIEARRHENT